MKKTKRKDNVFLRLFKNNGAVTFTTEGSDYQSLINDCEREKLKFYICKYPSFVTVVKK